MLVKDASAEGGWGCWQEERSVWIGYCGDGSEEMVCSDEKNTEADSGLREVHG